MFTRIAQCLHIGSHVMFQKTAEWRLHYFNFGCMFSVFYIKGQCSKSIALHKYWLHRLKSMHTYIEDSVSLLKVQRNNDYCFVMIILNHVNHPHPPTVMF